MKALLGKPFLLRVAIAALGSIVAGDLTAQTFTTLHGFKGNSDGAVPYAGLILSGNTLYGTAGTVFAVNTDGTGFTTLYTFTASSTNSSGVYTNSDGACPYAGLILSGNTLYGTAEYGGSSGRGTVFAVNTDGTGFTTLHNFAGYPNDGAVPYAGLVLSGNTLYGTAVDGGSSGNGTVFAVKTDGTGFRTPHNFAGGSDGAQPYAGLILSGNTLYGTTGFGGSSGNGTVFAVNTDGTGFRTLYTFMAGSGSFSNLTNSDGAYPHAGLILSGNTLYGAAVNGGSSGYGTVFAVKTDGTGFTNLHSFTSGDGANPFAGLILSGNTLYGTARAGGSSGKGTVFAVNTDGTGFTNLYDFTAVNNYTNSDGAYPKAGLILSGNTLYGTTARGGSSGYGTVFSLSLGTASPPQLTLIPSGANIILTWPTNAAGFTLQSTTNLVSPAVWTTVSPGPVVADGQNAVTNPIAGPQKFYRLSQ